LAEGVEEVVEVTMMVAAVVVGKKEEEEAEAMMGDRGKEEAEMEVQNGRIEKLGSKEDGDEVEAEAEMGGVDVVVAVVVAAESSVGEGVEEVGMKKLWEENHAAAGAVEAAEGEEQH
jgi:hypothetical protein